MKLYIAGPMSGIPQFNYPAFLEAGAALRSKGFEVLNPAEMDNEETKEAAMASEDGSLGSGTCNGETWGDFLSRDVKIVADECDGVAVLPGWEKSRGARLEAFIAINCLKPVFVLADDFTFMAGDPGKLASLIAANSVQQDNTERYGS